jgi:hypothetical protein
MQRPRDDNMSSKIGKARLRCVSKAGIVVESVLLACPARAEIMIVDVVTCSFTVQLAATRWAPLVVVPHGKMSWPVVA